MAHFAKIEDGIVTKVIVAEPEFFETFVDSSPGIWLQTSYNTRGGVHYDPVTNEPDGGVALRMNFAAVGGTYDAELDAFIPIKPHESWILNKETCLWEPPVPMPEDAGTGIPLIIYHWEEATQTWKKVHG